MPLGPLARHESAEARARQPDSHIIGWGGDRGKTMGPVLEQLENPIAAEATDRHRAGRQSQRHHPRAAPHTGWVDRCAAHAQVRLH